MIGKIGKNEGKCTRLVLGRTHLGVLRLAFAAGSHVCFAIIMAASRNFSLGIVGCVRETVGGTRQSLALLVKIG